MQTLNYYFLDILTFISFTLGVYVTLVSSPDTTTGTVSHSASKLNKTAKAAGGEAARGEADPRFREQKANFGANNNNN